MAIISIQACDLISHTFNTEHRHIKYSLLSCAQGKVHRASQVTLYHYIASSPGPSQLSMFHTENWEGLVCEITYMTFILHHAMLQKNRAKLAACSTLERWYGP